MVISIETDYEQQDITWQRFVPSGPQAFLPLSGHCGSLVWYNSADEIKRLKSISNEALIAELTSTFPKCLGKINKILAVASFPLKRQHAQQYVKTGVVLVGDAAHMINPLAGQGVNIGLLDAAALSEVLIEAHANNEDIAESDVLKRYEKMRRNENLRMMTVMDAFYRVFSNDVLPLRLVRNLGLGLAERVFPAKNKVMRMAIGLDGKLPKLARGQSIL
jgi:2-octaprenyl-3-methyl-6-methoxy-1,4-benzoquinol hydroxylase